MSNSKIDISGYNPTLSGDKTKETWQVLDDRIIFRKRSFWGKITETVLPYTNIAKVTIGGINPDHIVVDHGSRILTVLCTETVGKNDARLIREHLRSRVRNVEINLPKEMKEQDERITKKNSERLNQIQAGKWDFPAEKFYNACKNQAKLTALNNEYSVKKAQKIAEQYAAKEPFDRSYFDQYFTAEKLTYYFEKGKALAEKTAQRNAQKKVQAKCVVIKGAPTKEEKTFLDRVTSLLALTGSEKRKAMLSNLVQDYDVKIKALAEGEEALKTLGVAFLEQQKKETSWAIMGGIADGIAGPAAGLAVAAETAANNQKIKAHNANMRQAALDIMRGVPQLSDDRYGLEKEKEKILRQIKKTDEKISLTNPNAVAIWKNIKISDIVIKRNPSKVLSVAINISLKKSFVLDIPQDVRMVVDGTIKGEVWLEDTFVGEVWFPLPIYGISTKKGAEITLDGLCMNSTKTPGEYTLKLSDTQNVWVMEA